MSDDIDAPDSESDSKRRTRRQRGVFERPKGSGVWWVRYADEHGREHREKVGPKGLALKVSPVTGRVLDGKKKWRRAESNCGPRDYETLALAN